MIRLCWDCNACVWQVNRYLNVYIYSKLKNSRYISRLYGVSYYAISPLAQPIWVNERFFLM